MPHITALLHTKNDALRLGRALETLLPCAEILVVDHHSADSTLRIARAYGARVVAVDASANGHATPYASLARHDWIFCVAPEESITEGLQASLFEWTALSPEEAVGYFPDRRAFSVSVRRQVQETWMDLPTPETRLIPRDWSSWHGHMPAVEASSVPLEGHLLRFALP